MPTRAVVQMQDFDLATEYQRLLDSAPDTGGVVTFVGRVRAGEDRVRALTLEHYPAMAEAALTRIVATARARFPVAAINIVHRVGTLPAGAQIVFVGVAAAHRDEAFRACRFLIDVLKTQAPLWKKEHTDQGERWVQARAYDAKAARQWLE